jgi:hypothetical protein
MFRMVKGKGFRYRSKGGMKCKPASSTMKRHVKKHGCHGSKCAMHVSSAESVRAARAGVGKRLAGARREAKYARRYKSYKAAGGAM